MQTAAEQNINCRINFGDLARADYLAAAAELLAKAAATNEQHNARVTYRLQEGRERIAGQYAQLAAIQRGLLPAALAATIVAELEG